jgi:hypothetical protein
VSGGVVDSGWAAWLPLELLEALEALSGGAPARRALRQRLARPPEATARERWERFVLAAPSRIDVPATADGLTEERAFALLEDLGLVAGRPPRPIQQPEAVELVLSLDHEEQRELERLRAARFDDAQPVTPLDDLPSLDTPFGGREVGRNDPCPCGSGLKFKRCHGR